MRRALLVLLLAVPALAWSQEEIGWLRAPRIQVAALGDSITSGYAATTNYIAELTASLGPRYKPVNAGVISNKTADLLYRYQTNPNLAAQRYRYLIVLGGTNDLRLSLSTATAFANLKSIYDAHRAAGFKVIPMTVPPFGATGAIETERLSLNTMILGYCTDNGITCVDLSTAMAKVGAANLMADAYTTGQPDVIHPNDAGQRAIAAAIVAAGVIP